MPRLWLRVLLVVSLILLFVDLGGSTIWDANEAFYVETPRQMVQQGDYVNPSFNGQPRWNKPGFDESKWLPAKIFGSPGSELRGLSCAAPPLKFFETHKAVSSRALTNGDTLYDLAGRFYGDPELWPRIAKANPGVEPKALTVGQLMQDAVTQCTVRTDAATIAHLMTHRNYGSLPVVDEEGTLVGIVTDYDLLQAMIDGRDLRKVLATEIMSMHPLTVTEDQTLAQVADLFQDRYVTRVPVVRNNKLVGILARRDLLFGYMKASQYWS